MIDNNFNLLKPYLKSMTSFRASWSISAGCFKSSTPAFKSALRFSIWMAGTAAFSLEVVVAAILFSLLTAFA